MGVNLSSVEQPGYDRLAPSTVREMHSPFQIPDVEVEKCPECGGVFEGLGYHWQWSPEHRPSLTDHQRELVTGMMMSDGSLHRASKNPSLQVYLTEPRYLEHLDRQFGVLGLGVRLAQTATESARGTRRSGFCPDAEAKNYSDAYYWRTRCLPEMWDFDWYTDNGEKRWPSDLDLTPTVLRTLYCGDGSWQNHGSSDFINIGMANEIDHTDKVAGYFEDAGLPEPAFTSNEYEGGHTLCAATFSVEDSHTIWEYMAPAPPGFEYKFPEEYHGTNPLKRRLRGRDYRGPFAAVTLTDEELRKVPLEPRVNVDGTDRVTFDRHDLEGWL